jgi:hypothetical protein
LIFDLRPLILGVLEVFVWAEKSSLKRIYKDQKSKLERSVLEVFTGVFIYELERKNHNFIGFANVYRKPAL